MATSKTTRRQSRSTRRQTAATRNADKVEWIVAAVATLVVVALIGFLVFEAVTRSGGSPDLAVLPVESTSTRSGLAVVIEVDNVGHAAAAAVEIVGDAGADGQAGTVTIDYVPAEASRRATLILPPETRPEDVRLRVVGYADP